MKKDINKIIIGSVQKDGNGDFIPYKLTKETLDYILTRAYKLETEYNKDNNDSIEIDWLEIIKTKNELDISYRYNDYILTFETWTTQKELLNYIKSKEIKQ